MCLKKPKAPKVVADPALARQIEQASSSERSARSLAKENRFEDQLGFLNGGFGRRSLLSGSRGGSGYSMNTSRSMFSALR